MFCVYLNGLYKKKTPSQWIRVLLGSAVIVVVLCVASCKSFMMLLLLLALLFDVGRLILRQINCLVFFCFLVVVVAEFFFDAPSLISRQIGLSCCPRLRVYVCVVFFSLFRRFVFLPWSFSALPAS